MWQFYLVSFITPKAAVIRADICFQKCQTAFPKSQMISKWWAELAQWVNWYYIIPQIKAVNSFFASLLHVSHIMELQLGGRGRAGRLSLSLWGVRIFKKKKKKLGLYIRMMLTEFYLFENISSGNESNAAAISPLFGFAWTVTWTSSVLHSCPKHLKC